MITYRTGDIFESNMQCLVNPVNCVGIAGKGLALAFRRKYPSMNVQYKRMCESGQIQIGTVAFYRSTKIDHVICLFPTKTHWKYPSKLEYIDSALRAFLKYAPDFNITSVAFPKVGCGEGGLNFEYHVKPLIESAFIGTDYTVEVFV